MVQILALKSVPRIWFLEPIRTRNSVEILALKSVPQVGSPGPYCPGRALLKDCQPRYEKHGLGEVAVKHYLLLPQFIAKSIAW